MLEIKVPPQLLMQPTRKCSLARRREIAWSDVVIVKDSRKASD